MNYLVRNSIKVGLIASALLVFSACGSEDTSGDSKTPKVYNPLFDQQPIEAGDVCEFGGTMVRGGLDKDGDGELSDSEATSKTPVCKAEDEGGEIPKDFALLVETETLEIGHADCPDGGQRVHVGYDLDEDGALSAEEIAAGTTKTTDLCNSGPIDACVGAEQLEIVSIELEEDPFGYHEVNTPYEVRVEFNHEIDTESLELKDILETLGDDALVYTVDPDNNKVAILEFQGDMNNTAYSMAIAANDGCTTGTAGLRTPALHHKQSRINVTYDAPGFTAAGDKIELCYETRGADECITTIRGVVDAAAPTDGCIEITADATDIANEAVPVKIVCKDTQIPGSFSVQHLKMIPTIPTLISFDSAEFPGLVAAEEVDLHWETFQMDSCELSDGTDSVDVPVNEPKHTVLVEETTDFVLTCKDADDNVFSKTRRITVGPGILSFEAKMTQRAPGFPLQFGANWESSLLYGTCDVKFEYASTLLEPSNIIQQADYMISPRYRRGAINSNQQSPAEDLDAQIQGTATLTCRGNNATVAPQSLTMDILQY